MNKARISEIFILMASLFLSANSNLFSQAGGAAVPFLMISPDARSSGMGETGTAIADDINAVFWNPAGLSFLDYSNKTREDEEPEPFRQASITYSRWLPQFNADLYYAYATYGQYIEEANGTMAVNFTFMNLGEFIRTYETGEVGRPFQSTEWALSLAYGTIIATDLGIGFQFRYIQSNLAPQKTSGDAGVGRSFSIDLSLMWKPMDLEIGGMDLGEKLSLGFNLSNIGPKMTYLKESDPLPTMLKIGAAYNIIKDEFNDLKFAIDVGKLLVYRDSVGSDPVPISLVSAWKNAGVELSLGVEYWYDNVVAFRGGFFTEPSVLGNRKYWNFGAGVRYDVFNLDFSYINTVEENHPLANTMRFSMLVDL